MRESRHRRGIRIALVVVGCFSSILLYGQTRVTKGGEPDAASPASSLRPGPYYALVIGNNDYKYLNRLQTAINDARDMARLLQERYGFQTKVLLDADRSQILSALVEYRRTLPKNSNLLIYYAGHGHHDPDTDEAYWLPVDAQSDNNANWISADDITRDVRAIPSSHVLVIADSCYSGYLAREADAAINPRDRSAYLAKMLESKSRTLMSSGGDEPVADSGAPGHSVFAWAILKSLRQIGEDQFTANYLFSSFIQPAVGGESYQLPQYSWIRDSGHEYGDFVFSRQPMAQGSSMAASPVPPGNVAGSEPDNISGGVPAAPKPATTQHVRISSGESQALLIHQVQPAYPPLARQAGIHGTVVLHALIGKDGTIKNLQVLSGHPMLTSAAVAAVKGWTYKPYYRNGEPIEVETEIDVSFKLNGAP